MGRGTAAVGLLLAGAAGACELTEVSVTSPEDVVVAEVYVQAYLDGGGRVTALLHRTLGATGEAAPVPSARVTVRSADGATLSLVELGTSQCALSWPPESQGSCYFADLPEDRWPFRFGSRLELVVDLPEGGRLESVSTLPGAFRLSDLESGVQGCRLDPGTPSLLRWSPSSGTWAYITEALIGGLRAHFPDDVEVDDPLYLLGLSISASDTTLVFPGELGVFARADLDREVSLALQEGLPPGTVAEVSVSAVDRNWVNWVRGGNFNPSGQVRVPSVRGDGTGVFATAAVRRLTVVVEPPGSGPKLPPCPPPPPDEGP